jgi:hypothetical protein
MLALRDKEGMELWSTDVAVPLSRLPDIIGKISPPLFSSLELYL